MNPKTLDYLIWCVQDLALDTLKVAALAGLILFALWLI